MASKSGGSATERKTVNMLNEFMKEDGFAYRLKQSRFASQIIDVLLDSHKYGFYAIECKSVKYTTDKKGKGRPIYFKQYFTISKKDNSHQINNISKFIHKSGRVGIFLVELRKGPGHKNKLYALSWKRLEKKFNAGENNISWDYIFKYAIPFKPDKFFKKFKFKMKK